MEKQTHRYAFLDDNLLRLTLGEIKKDICPLASAKYSSVLTWKGKGVIPEEEKKLLMQYVTEAHKQGKRVRLWASPENTTEWKELLGCGVDLINTDQLEELKNFLLKR